MDDGELQSLRDHWSSRAQDGCHDPSFSPLGCWRSSASSRTLRLSSTVYLDLGRHLFLSIFVLNVPDGARRPGYTRSVFTRLVGGVGVWLRPRICSDTRTIKRHFQAAPGGWRGARHDQGPGSPSFISGGGGAVLVPVSLFWLDWTTARTVH